MLRQRVAVYDSNSAGQGEQNNEVYLQVYPLIDNNILYFAISEKHAHKKIKFYMYNAQET